MQAGAGTARVTGFEGAQRTAPGDPLSGSYRGTHRFVGGAQAALVIDRHRRLTRDLAREHHDAVSGGQHRLPRGAGKVDPAMSGQPIVFGPVESAHECRAGTQRPIECAGRRRVRRIYRRHRRGDRSRGGESDQRPDPSHAPIFGRTADAAEPRSGECAQLAICGSFVIGKSVAVGRRGGFGAAVTTPFRL